MYVYSILSKGIPYFLTYNTFLLSGFGYYAPFYKYHHHINESPNLQENIIFEVTRLLCFHEKCLSIIPL